MAEEKESAELKRVHLKLQSQDEVEVLAGINRLKKVGQASSFPHIVNLLNTTESSSIYDKGIDLISHIKIKEADILFIKAIQNIENQSLIKDLLSSFWQAGLDAYPHFEFFIDLAIQSDDYMIVFECITILDTIDDEIENEVIEKNIKKLAETIKVESKNKEILTNLHEILTEKLLG